MLYPYMPDAVARRLWGDRKRFGLEIVESDAEWVAWEKKSFHDFYEKTQQKGVGDLASSPAFKVVSRVDFKGLRVLEYGPGRIRHLEHMRSKPDRYCICDIQQACLDASGAVLEEAGIQYDAVPLNPGDKSKLPFKDGEFDVLLSFNTLEHLYPLDKYLAEFERVLCPGGVFVGGIPCEGGLAWGLGRFLTTRRYVHKNYGINYDKIICWAHPNFADFIIRQLDDLFKRKFFRLHPFPWLPMDLNLTASFVYERNF